MYGEVYRIHYWVEGHEDPFTFRVEFDEQEKETIYEFIEKFIERSKKLSHPVVRCTHKRLQ